MVGSKKSLRFVIVPEDVSTNSHSSYLLLYEFEVRPYYDRTMHDLTTAVLRVACYGQHYACTMIVHNSFIWILAVYSRKRKWVAYILREANLKDPVEECQIIAVFFRLMMTG